MKLISKSRTWQVEGWTDFNPYFHPRENLCNYSVAIYDLRQTPSVLFLHLQNGYQWAQYRAGHKGGNKGEATTIIDDNWVHASPPSSLLPEKTYSSQEPAIRHPHQEWNTYRQHQQAQHGQRVTQIPLPG